jgi:hypothetical protein
MRQSILEDMRKQVEEDKTSESAANIKYLVKEGSRTNVVKMSGNFNKESKLGTPEVPAQPTASSSAPAGSAFNIMPSPRSPTTSPNKATTKPAAAPVSSEKAAADLTFLGAAIPQVDMPLGAAITPAPAGTTPLPPPPRPTMQLKVPEITSPLLAVPTTVPAGGGGAPVSPGPNTPPPATTAAAAQVTAAAAALYTPLNLSAFVNVVPPPQPATPWYLPCASCGLLAGHFVVDCPRLAGAAAE